METPKRPPMEISFSETEAFVAAHDDKGKEEEAAPPVAEVPKLPPKPHPGPNLLLSEEEALEIRKQEIMSSFLIGVGCGAAAVGAFLFVRWILKPDQTASLRKALEKSF